MRVQSLRSLMPLLILATLPGCTSQKPASRISLSGNIELRDAGLGFRLAGTIVELVVEEGDKVPEGARIARLDDSQLQAQRAQARAAVEGARSKVAEAEAVLRYQSQAVEALVAQRVAELNQARAFLRELRAGSRKQEIDQARAAVERARTNMVRAEKDWRRAEDLFRTDDISAIQHDQYKASYDSAAASVTEVEKRLELLIEGPREEDIEAAEAQVARAQAALEAAETQRLDIPRLEKSIQAARAELERTEAQLAYADSQLADTVLSAPFSGTVLIKAAEIGEVVSPGATVVVLGDLEHPWLRGYVSETDLGRVRLGAPVKLKTDSFPGKEYAGRVTFISSEAEFTPKQIQTAEERTKLVYRVKIEIDNPNQELKLNMPVDAEIVLEQEG